MSIPNRDSIEQPPHQGLILAVVLSLAQTQIMGQLADETSLDGRTMGTLGFSGALLAQISLPGAPSAHSGGCRWWSSASLRCAAWVQRPGWEETTRVSQSLAPWPMLSIKYMEHIRLLRLAGSCCPIWIAHTRIMRAASGQSSAHNALR